MIKSVLVFMINLATEEWERMFYSTLKNTISKGLFHFVFSNFLLRYRKHKYS